MRAKLIVIGAVAVASLGSAALANVVVVRSLGPSSKAYPPGKTFPESASFALKGGDVVTVLGPSSAQTLRGPGNFAAKQVALASAAGQRGRFGALRSGEVAHNPSIWDLDVTQSGKVCVTKASKLQLWRPESDGAMKVTIRSADGKSQELSWPAGKASTIWPAGLPIANAAAYSIEWPDSGDKSDVTFVTIAPPSDDLVSTAQALIENGCQNQLDLLVQSASKAK